MLKRRAFLPLLLLILATAGGREARGQALEQIKSQAELEKVLAGLDAALFDTFNKCDLKTFRTFFADDVEFYHDQAGPSQSVDKLVEDLKNNICGRGVKREVIPESLEAHLMKNFGAVQIGRHRFLHPKPETPTGEARFIHLWRYKDGAWKITRVLSFDHHAVK